MDSDDTFRFVCGECGYKARIPQRFANMYIKCPGCHTNQQAARENSQAVPSSGDTVTIQAIKAQDLEPAPPKADEKFRFLCGSCGYRARMPVKYVGMAIKCPGCGKAQLAKPDEAGAATGNTAVINKPTPSKDPSKFLFVCPSCGYRARLPGKYKSQHIKCPGCNSAQQAHSADDSGPSTGSTVVIHRVDLSAPPVEPPRMAEPVLETKDLAPVQAPAPVVPPPAPEPVGLDLGGPVVAEPPSPPMAPAEPVPTAGLDLAEPPLSDTGEPPAEEPAPVSLPAPTAKAKPPEFDPFKDQRKSEPPLPEDEAAKLLRDMRKNNGSGSTRSRPASSASTPLSTAPSGKPPSKPQVAPVAEPEVEAAPVKSGKGEVVVLLVLLLMALGGAGYLGKMWWDVKNTLDSTEKKLATKIQELTTTAAQLADEKAAKTGTNHGKTEQELSSTKATLKTTEEDLNRTKTQLEQTAKDLEATIKQRDEALTALADTKAKLEATEKDLTETKAKLESTENTRAELETKAGELGKAKADLETKLSAAIADSDKKEAARKTLLDGKSQEVDRLKAEVDPLKAKVQNLEKENAELKTKVQDLESKLPKKK